MFRDSRDYILNPSAEEKKITDLELKISKYRITLSDAAGMFEEIERNRQMPPFAQTINQYIAFGKEIRKILND